MLIFRMTDLVSTVSCCIDPTAAGRAAKKLTENKLVEGGMGWSLRRIFYKEACFNLTGEFFPGFHILQVMLLVHATIFCRECWVIILESIKELLLLTQHHFIYLFFFVFNNLTTPQLCVTHFQGSPYSQQSKQKLKDGKPISLHRTKQMSVLVPGNLHVLNVL